MIEVKNLVKSFDGNVVLNGISETIEKGEKVVVIGPSGSGKSTMLRCLIDLEKVDQVALLHAQSLYLCRSGEGAGRGQIGFSSGENRDQVAGKAAALVKFVMKYVGKYILDHDMSASLFIWNDAPERENVSQPAF